MSMRPDLVHHLIEQSAARLPDKVAVRHLGRNTTYGELLEEARRMKEFLQGEGMRKGDRIGVLLEKSVEQLSSMFAISMAGGVFVFINPILRKEQIDYIVKDCGIKILITSAVLARKAGLDMPGKMLYVDMEGPGDFPVWPLIRDRFQATPERSAPSPAIPPASSTLPAPPACPRGSGPSRTVVDGAEIVGGYLDITEDDRIISILPFNFDYGLNQATSSILRGQRL